MIKSSLTMDQSSLLCNEKFSVYRSRMDKDNLDSFRTRLKKAIEESPPSQTEIANYCEVTVQSVGGWKRTGQISKENLRKLSEITGYRYVWLLDGDGPEQITSREENRREMGVFEDYLEYNLSKESPNTERLLKALRFALANKRLSDDSIGALADFVNTLVTKADK